MLVVFQACKDKDFLCVCPFSVINIKTEYCLDPSSYQGNHSTGNQVNSRKSHGGGFLMIKLGKS